MINESCDSVGETPSPYIRKFIVRTKNLITELLEIGAALFCYTLGKTFLQIGAASLL